MNGYRMGEVEMRFADIIWESEPLTTKELVAIAAKELEWSRSTTYTILGRLCDKGIFKKEGKIVSAVVTKEEVVAAQSAKFVEDTFSGSLPRFLAAFSLKKKLSDTEIDEIQAFINEHREK